MTKPDCPQGSAVLWLSADLGGLIGLALTLGRMIMPLWRHLH